MHLMKHLFKQFMSSQQMFEDGLTSDKFQEVTNVELKIPAVQLFEELGKLFDTELKANMKSVTPNASSSLGN